MHTDTASISILPPRLLKHLVLQSIQELQPHSHTTHSHSSPLPPPKTDTQSLPTPHFYRGTRGGGRCGAVRDGEGKGDGAQIKASSHKTH
ncbi:hypothetical protein E2C01_002702 [Portunus trituberculatus]|uniref:Uncharacterized protein n=1 Tax=Portunus trituberculatus TaxID=210409 RepID=A0A5B7CLF6_PORTR|nr:hypothetical protein [Portunus trituberculatus]